MIEDLIPALNELRAARPAYEEADMYREGEAPEKFASPAIQKALRGGTKDFAVNLAARPVDAVLDRLEITGVVCAPDQHTALFETAVWEANELDIEYPEVHDKALTFGDAYLFVWPSAGSRDEEEDGEQVARVDGVDIFYNSPLTCRAIYDDENPRLMRMVIKAWSRGSGKERETRVNLYYADHCEKWVTTQDARGKDEDRLTEADFEPFLDEHTDGEGQIPNQWGRPPFFHFRTRRPYGKPVHKNAYGSQDAITKLITNQMAASDFSAFPQRYGLLEATAGSDDDVDWGEDDETEPADRDSQLVASPGSMWNLRHYKEVGQFAPTDPDAFLKPQGQFMRFMAATTTTPSRWFDPSGDAPSGESLRADDAPLAKKVEAFHRSFGATWKDAGEFALRILGVTAKVTIQWAPPQATDDLEFWQAVQARQDAGVPIRQTLLEAGYTDAEVSSWGYTEDEPNGPDWSKPSREEEPPVPALVPPAPPVPPTGDDE